MAEIRFQDKDERNCVVNVPVCNQEVPMVLRMWVAYDRGHRYSQYDYSEVKRGYYLYFSLEEIARDYPARIFSINGKNCRVYLGEVKRKSKGWHRDFARLAETIAPAAMKELFSEFKFDLEQVSFRDWSGRGSGVGLYCDFYKIILPKVEWLY